jgi:hypothetical protein
MQPSMPRAGSNSKKKVARNYVIESFRREEEDIVIREMVSLQTLR